MSPLTPEQRDAVQEAIDRQTLRIKRIFRAFFGEEPTDEELLRADRNISQGVHQAVRQMETQRKPPPQRRAPTMADFAEGGFVNDRSGQATERMRRSLGIGGP